MKNIYKSCCTNINGKEYNHLKYVQIREHNGWENFKMLEVEKYPCNDGHEAEAREEEVRLDLQADTNSRKCFRTDEEIIQYQKEYRVNDSDVLNKKKGET